MPYDIALGRAWDEIGRSSPSSRYVTPLLTETYDVNIDSLTVLSNSSGIPADEGIAVLILHYLIGMQKQQGFSPSGECISSRELEGGISFLPAFQESVIKPLVECLGIGPNRMIKNLMEGRGPLASYHAVVASNICQICTRDEHLWLLAGAS